MSEKTLTLTIYLNLASIKSLNYFFFKKVNHDEAM